MGSLPVINTTKELVQSFQPLLLATINFASGANLYLSTNAVTYGGHAYLPRILSFNLGPVQSNDNAGVSVASTASLKCADADAFLWTNFEQPLGFKGSVLTLTFVYYDIVSGEFSPDSIIKFIGRCGSPTSMDDKTLTIPALNYYNLAPYNLPSLQIQSLCPWIFPSTTALQEAAANGTNQQSKECPYNPSGSTNPVGNLDPSTSLPYTSCGKAKSDCQARGMYNGDSSSRKTGCFGGIQFNPPTSSISRSYETSKWQQIINNGPEARYGDMVPLLYGTGWASCKILNSWSDANYWRGEVLVSYGLVGAALMVLCNNIQIPHDSGDGIFASTPPGVTSTQDALRIGFWYGVNNGSVYSQPSLDYNGQGDPYGSMAVIYLEVVVDIAAADSLPNVQVLIQGQQVRVYTSPTSYTMEYTSNPWWIIMDLLTWANLEYEQLDIQGFINEAAWAAYAIPYINQYGNSGVHPRFDFTLSLTQANTADQTLRSCLNAVRGYLVPNYAGGLLSPRTSKTLADQQPSAVDGSNYNTPVPSFNYAGVPTDGYLAYYFMEGTIAVDTNGDTTLKVPQAPIQQAPNRLGYVFQDSENTYNQDSIAITDDEDVNITGQVINGNIQINGPNTFDHGQRIIASKLAEGYRGNMRLAADGETIGDTRGTYTAVFQTSHRVVKLNMGDIVAIDSVKYGWSLSSYLTSDTPPPFFRVQKVEPSDNYERVTITATYHNDAWYLDEYGQTGAPLWTSGWRSPTLNGARPLSELGIPPITYGNLNGNLKASVTLQIAPGINVPSGSIQPPYVPVQALTANTGGALPGGIAYYICLVAQNSTGYSAPSLVSMVYVAAGTSTNTAEVNNLYWDASTTGFQVYAGTHPSELSLQSANYTTSGGTSAQPATITITGALNSNGELPDNKLSFVRFKQERVAYPGIWTGQLLSASYASSLWTLQLEVGAGTPFTTNALVGRQIALLGRATPTEGSIYPLAPAATYPTALTITANTSNTITVSGDPSNLMGFQAGDQITIRMMPTIGSDGGGNYIEDPWFVNPNSTGLSAAVFDALLFLPNLRIVSGTGSGYTMMANISTMTATKLYIYGAWPVTPDSTSIFIIDEGGWDQTLDTSTIYNDGNLGTLSFSLDVSKYIGTTILVQAVSCDANGNESSSIQAPMREAFILQNSEIDTGNPPVPFFVLLTDGQGNALLQQVGFAPDSVNISTVTSGTLQLFTWNIVDPGFSCTLTSALTSAATSLSLSAALPSGLGDGVALLIDSEIVVAVGGLGTTTPTVVRAQLGTSAAAHSVGATVSALTATVFTPSFPPLFFEPTNAAAQSVYEYSIPIPRQIIYAAEFLVTNSIGPSEASISPFTPVGLSTGAQANSMVTITAYGTLGIKSDISPAAQTGISFKASAVYAKLALGPIGSAFTIDINVGGTLWLSLTIPAVTSAVGSSVYATSAQIAALTTIPAFTDITVDITAVGGSIGTGFPGAALTVQIFQ